MSLFTLRGSLSKVQSLILGLVGLVIFLGIWWLMAEWFAIDKSELSETPRVEEAEGDFGNLDAFSDFLSTLDFDDFELHFCFDQLPPPLILLLIKRQ